MPPESARPHAARLAHPDVARKIELTLPEDLPRADRHDVRQNVYMRLLRLRVLPEKHEWLLGLVVKTTRWAFLDWLRDEAGAPEPEEELEPLEETLAEADPRDPYVAERIAEVFEVLERDVARGALPPQVLENARMLLGGMTHDEIARATGRPAGTVMSEMHRAWGHVRRRLKRQESAPPA